MFRKSSYDGITTSRTGTHIKADCINFAECSDCSRLLRIIYGLLGSLWLFQKVPTQSIKKHDNYENHQETTDNGIITNVCHYYLRKSLWLSIGRNAERLS